MKKGSDNRSKKSEKQGIRGDKENKERRKINRRERSKRIGREREKKKRGYFSGIPTVEARWSEKKSRSTQHELA